MLEQLREQYFDRGRACSWQSGHAQITPPATSAGAVCVAAAAGLAGVFVGAAGAAAGGVVARFDGFGSISCSRSVDTDPVNMASSSEGFRRGTNRLGVLFAFFERALFGSYPSGIGGRSSMGGRLFEQSQHCSMFAGRTSAGRCRPHAQCSYSFQYTFVRRDKFLMGVAKLPWWTSVWDPNVYHQLHGKWKAREKIRVCCEMGWNPSIGD